MEVMPRSASPPPLRFDSPYATAPSSPRATLGAESASSFGSVEGSAGRTFLTAPPSPDPFDVLPPSTPRLAGGAYPFDLFQHFTSAPASPRRAAAIYAHFAAEDNGRGHDDDDDDEEEFQPRASYATNVSAVPFDWEETPGTPKTEFGGGAAWDIDFEFGTVVGGAVPAESQTTADELFEKGRIRPMKQTVDEVSDKGKIRPLKPPPGLLDGGSVVSSPRSPMVTKATLRSPRRRSKVGSGLDFDPFAAALLEATKAPSPLGGVAPHKKPDQFSKSAAGQKKKWRLSDLLLFRSSSDGRRFDQDSVHKFSPDNAPAKKATDAKFDAMRIKPKKHADNKSAATAEGIVGCARLSPLQRLAKGLGGHSWHHGRGIAAPKG